MQRPRLAEYPSTAKHPATSNWRSNTKAFKPHEGLALAAGCQVYRIKPQVALEWTSRLTRLTASAIPCKDFCYFSSEADVQVHSTSVVPNELRSGCCPADPRSALLRGALALLVHNDVTTNSPGMSLGSATEVPDRTKWAWPQGLCSDGRGAV
jgi:hypothetical protein